MTPLDPELATLVRRLETGVADTSGKFRAQGRVIIVGSVAMAGYAAVRDFWVLSAVCLLFGVSIYFTMNAAATNSSPEKAEPVLEALRIAPGRIKKIRHRITSDSKRIFITHWIDVVGDEGHLMVRADHDWRFLLAKLVKRCPQAEVTEPD